MHEQLPMVRDLYANGHSMNDMSSWGIAEAAIDQFIHELGVKYIIAITLVIHVAL